jgi:hypothetical protein
MWLGEMDTEMPGPGPGSEEYWKKWMREVEETGSEQDTGGVREGRERRRDRQTLQDEAHDLFTQETHEPGHQHTSASRSHDDPCCCCCCGHGTPLSSFHAQSHPALTTISRSAYISILDGVGAYVSLPHVEPSHCIPLTFMPSFPDSRYLDNLLDPGSLNYHSSQFNPALFRVCP